MDALLISDMKDTAEENRRSKRMYAGMNMQTDLPNEALGKCVKAVSETRVGRECGRTARREHRVGVQSVPDQRDLLQVQPNSAR